MTDLFIFVPMYNCAPQISRVLDKVDRTIKIRSTPIVLIDNQSKDHTLDEAIRLAKKYSDLNIQIFRNSENYGLGGSHKVAFNYGIEKNLNYCLILHGDDQADIKDFEQIINLKQYRDYAMILGSRFAKEAKRVNYSYLRVLGNLFFNCVASLLTLKKISDLGGSGINIFSISDLTQGDKKWLGFANDLTFHVYLLLESIEAKSKIMFMPITWREEDQISNVRLLKQTKNLFKILGHFMIHRKAPKYSDLADKKYVTKEVFRNF